METENRTALSSAAIQNLISLLSEDGYRVIGPQVRDGAIVWDELESSDDLPQGWRDNQEAGRYRLEKTERPNLFDYNVGPHSPKKFLYPPQEPLWRAEVTEEGLRFLEHALDERPLAFLGIRQCELAAIGVQDKVLVASTFADDRYARRRETALFISVEDRKSVV